MIVLESWAGRFISRLGNQCGIRVFGSLDANTKVTYSYQKGSTARWDRNEVLSMVLREAMVVKINWFNSQYALGVRSSWASLT